MNMKLSPESKLVLKYLALPMAIGGRGGALRFFLLAQDIPFDEKLFDMAAEWPAEKERLAISGENPAATVPVVYADGKPLTQHIATARLLSTVHKRSALDIYENYVQDMVADEYQAFRDAWVHHAFSATDEEKATYKKETLPKQLVKFNAMYEHNKIHDVYMSVGEKTKQPLWGDAALFGLIRDNILTGLMAREDLTKYEKLEAMYSAFEKIPAVAEWIAAKK